MKVHALMLLRTILIGALTPPVILGYVAVRRMVGMMNGGVVKAVVIANIVEQMVMPDIRVKVSVIFGKEYWIKWDWENICWVVES